MLYLSLSLPFPPLPFLMKSSQPRLHNCCRDLSCVILGVRPMFPFTAKSTTMLPNGALCCSHYKTGRREGRLGAGGLAVQRRLGHILHALHQPWERGSGMLHLNAWEEPLPAKWSPYCPWPPGDAAGGRVCVSLCWFSHG